MNKIAITIDHEVLRAAAERPLLAGSVGVTSFTAEFDESWEPYVKTIVFTAGDFYNTQTKAVLYTGGEMQVPWEVLQAPGELWISASGVCDGVIQPTALMDAGLPILISGPLMGEEPRPATEEVWQQVLTEVGAIREATQAVSQAVTDAQSAADTAAGAASASGQSLSAVLESQEAAEAARDSAIAAAENVTSHGLIGAKVNGTPLPVVQNMVDIPVPTDQQVGQWVSQEVAPIQARTVTLTASGWSSDLPCIQTVSVSGVNADWIPGFPTLVPAGDQAGDLAAQKALQCVSLIASGADSMTFTCYETRPAVDITVRIPGLLM